MFVHLLRRFDPLRTLPPAVRYGLTVALVLACLGLRWGMGGVAGSERIPIFLIFVPAVVLAAVLFDSGAGLLATGLSALAVLFFFAEPVGSFRASHSGELWGLAAFVAIGILAAVLIEALRESVDELTSKRDELARRTEELTRQSEQLQEAREELLQESERRSILLADLNHRIKNHLASIAAGLTLSRRSVEDEKARNALDTAAARLNVLGRVYTRLHLDGSEAKIEARDFLETLCSDLSSSVIGTRPIVMSTFIEPARLNAKCAGNLGLIINELVTNSLKYAFPEDRPGRIEVRFSQDADIYRLEVSDDGVGLTSDGEEKGTGRKLVHALAGQLGGEVHWDLAGGTRAVVELPDL